MRRYLKNILGSVREAADKVADVIQQVREAVVAEWRRHRERISDPAYVEALIAVVMAAVELINAGGRVRYVAHQVLAAYIAVLRASGARPPAGWDDQQGDQPGDQVRDWANDPNGGPWPEPT